jgi:hypothetical protein
MKKVRYTSPIGIAFFPKLNSPDFTFEKKNGVYETGLILSAEDSKPLLDICNEYLEMLKEEVKKDPKTAKKQLKRINDSAKLPYQEETDEEGEPTGNLIWVFRANAGGTDKEGRKWERKIPLFDAKGNPIDPNTVQIWGGSKIRVSFSPSFYNTAMALGVKFYLEAVQIIELANYERGAETFGFDTVDGFDVSEYQPKATADTEVNEDDEDLEEIALDIIDDEEEF